MKSIACRGLVALLAATTFVSACVDENDEQPEEPTGPPPVSEFSVPLAVAPGGCPIESRDGKLLYTAAGPAGTNGLDMYALRRNADTNVYDARTKLGDPVSLDTSNDFCPTPLMGDYLMFVSNRPAAMDEPPKCGQDGGVVGLGGADIFLTRYSVQQPAAGATTLTVASTGPAVRLACYPDGPNTAGTKFAPSLLTTPDGGYLFFSSEHNGTAPTGSQDLYMSEMRPDGTYGPGAPITELNTTFDDQQPNVSRDGLIIVFASTRGGNMDIYMSTRTSLTSAWSAPRNLSVEFGFPTAALAETRPSISWDQKRFYYGADGQAWLSFRTLPN